MAPLTSTPQASLVGVTLAQGELEQALAHVEPMLSLLTADEPLVLDEPFEVYLTCYRVLEASGDVRAASLLQRAEQRLRECAEHIIRFLWGWRRFAHRHSALKMASSTERYVSELHMCRW